MGARRSSALALGESAINGDISGEESEEALSVWVARFTRKGAGGEEGSQYFENTENGVGDVPV